MELTIPEGQRADVRTLFSLPDEVVRSLAKTLERTAPTASYGKLADAVAGSVDLPRRKLVRVLRLLGVLASLRDELEWDAARMAEAIVDAARAVEAPPISPADQNWDRLVLRLTVLLDNLAAVFVTKKASDLRNDYQHTYCVNSSRVLSDIRPIFPAGSAAAPQSAIIVHSLKLAYHQGDETREFFVALQASDIRHLRDMLDRAISKEEEIRKWSDHAQLSIVGDSGSDD